MLQGEHSAILSTFIKLPLSLRYLFYLSLTGRFTQVLLYNFLYQYNPGLIPSQGAGNFSAMLYTCCGFGRVRLGLTPLIGLYFLIEWLSVIINDDL